MSGGRRGAGVEDSAGPLALDSLSMWEATLGLPEQVAQSASDAAGVLASVDPSMWSGPIANVVILGMGGSGVAGDVAGAVAAPRLAVPTAVVKSYGLPRFVGPTSLVLAVSCSGETEETLAAATAAWEAGATVVAVSRGGTLGQMAQDRGAPFFPVPAGVPQPRAALGAMAVPLLAVLSACGLLADGDRLVATAVDQLQRRRDELVGPGGPAHQVAAAIGRTMALVHGGEGPGAVAARRWKTQINENAKAPAFSAVQPELCHNEVAGWGIHGDVTRQVLSLVLLRCRSDHPQVARRMELVKELLLEVVHEVVEVWGAGQSDLAELFDLVLVGDVVSLLIAGAEQVDPGPVPVLDEIKAGLRS